MTPNVSQMQVFTPQNYENTIKIKSSIQAGNLTARETECLLKDYIISVDFCAMST